MILENTFWILYSRKHDFYYSEGPNGYWRGFYEARQFQSHHNAKIYADIHGCEIIEVKATYQVGH